VRVKQFVGAVIVSLLDALLIGNIVTVFSGTAGGAVVFMVSWIALTYSLYRFFSGRTLVGSFVLSLGIVALLVPLGMLFVGSRSEGFGPLAGLIGGIVLAIVLGPLGLIFTFIGFWLINQGIRRQKAQVQQPVAKAEGARYCANCGSQIQLGMAFCPKCGAKQT
jgi:hypothetical protein